ncbi:glutathione S-transferase 1-like [Aphomia sociella]
MVLILYKLDPSPPVRAVYMVIEILDILDIQYVDVNLFEKEHLNESYLQMNPQHTIPTLKDDDFVIWDSHAICVYLLTKYGKDDSLYPVDPKMRAIIDQRLHFNSGILFPALRSNVAPILFKDQKNISEEGAENIKSAYEFIDKFLKDDPWLAGDQFTLADICCVSTISTLNELIPIDGDQYPNLLAWLERCSTEEFYKKGNEPGLSLFRQLLKSKLG